MIRNVVLGHLRDAPDDAARERDRAVLDDALKGIAALDLPGLLQMHVGFDAELREGGASFAITNDWVDAEAYRGYDVDAEHNTHRARVAQVCSRIERAQFTID